ncbi:MAG: hypothetical protein R3C56_39565 [Pirellulaceae bacterium]
MIRIVSVCACCAASLGCQPSATSSKSAKSSRFTDTADYDRFSAGHDHIREDVGPHGGHMLHLEPTGSHAEWTHDDDQHLVTVYLDEFDAASIVSAKFTAKIGDATEEFPLTNGDSSWTVTSPELMTHINMKDAAEVNLIIVDDAGVHTAKIEAHEHHHH